VRPVPAILVALVLGGVAWLWIGKPGAPPPAAPSPELDRPPPPPASEIRTRPPATTGTLVIRVSPSDGKDLPEAARAGYAKYGGPPRMRTRGSDGSFRFTDAPVGPVEVMADVPGYREAKGQVVVQAGVPSETVLVVEPLDGASK
jgi:hypothetical protein